MQIASLPHLNSASRVNTCPIQGTFPVLYHQCDAICARPNLSFGRPNLAYAELVAHRVICSRFLMCVVSVQRQFTTDTICERLSALYSARVPKEFYHLLESTAIADCAVGHTTVSLRNTRYINEEDKSPRKVVP